MQQLGELAEQPEIDSVTRSAAKSLSNLAGEPLRQVSGGLDYVPTGGDESKISVILPGSVGLHLINNNEVFLIERVYWNPKENCLFYRGRLDSMINPDDHLLTQVERVQPIPGESLMAIYDVETGEIEPL
jgi:hypothetical protein